MVNSLYVSSSVRWDRAESDRARSSLRMAWAGEWSTIAVITFFICVVTQMAAFCTPCSSAIKTVTVRLHFKSGCECFTHLQCPICL